MIINSNEIIDWYDDIITSIVNIEDRFYLSNCIWKNFDTNEKRYYTIEIPKETFLYLKSILNNKKTFHDNDWKHLNKIFKENNQLERVFLITTNSLKKGNIISLQKVLPNDIKELTFPFNVEALY